MGVRELSRDEMAALSPEEYRLMVRRGEWPQDLSSEYCCEGYTQHGLIALPRDWAYDYLLFCSRNPKVCFSCDATEPGSPYPPLLGPEADVRTDIGRYRIFKDGEVIDEPTDVKKYWRDDLVAFLTPCSFSFEGVLRKYNVNFRYIGTFTSKIPTVPAGRFKSVPMCVTCRLFKTSHDAVRAIQITSRFPFAHAAPIHIGGPEAIGIKDVYHPEPGRYNPHPTKPPPPQEPNEVMMFWACAETPTHLITTAKPPFAITHCRGMLFISDWLSEELAYLEETHLYAARERLKG